MSAFASPLVLAILVLIAIFTSKTGMFQRLDYRLYDFMLGLTKEIETTENIVLVDIDDESLGRIGAWPWTRDILGNALLRMKEFGAKTAVFDIEYLSSADVIADIETTPVVMSGSAFLTTCKTVIVKPEVA